MSSNDLRTALLLGGLTGLMLWVGQSLGGTQGLTVALVGAAVVNIGSFWFSDKIVLGMYRARPLTDTEAPEVLRIVRELSQLNRMPTPAVYLIESDAPNAFATGRSPAHAAVAVTTGIVRMLDQAELRGVLAHELSHVKNRDTLTSTIAATLAGVIMWVASMARWGLMLGGSSRDDREGEGIGALGLLAMIIFAPLAAGLIQMAISRSREFAADAGAARVTSDPFALASALEKLSHAAGRVPMGASPQTAHLFIVNPLTSGSLAKLFSTHPPMEERIRRLRAREY
jgi:heat shock protein HtpX